MRHALIGGLTAAVLWKLSRRLLLLWYFSTLSQISTVYGSLTTAIAMLLSLEVAATLLVFGAQVISEYERIDVGGSETFRVTRRSFSHRSHITRTRRCPTGQPGAGTYDP